MTWWDKIVKALAAAAGVAIIMLGAAMLCKKEH